MSKKVIRHYLPNNDCCDVCGLFAEHYHLEGDLPKDFIPGAPPKVAHNPIDRKPPFYLTDERVAETFEKAQRYIDDYGVRHASMTIGDLLDLEDNLAVMCAYLGELVARYNKDYTEAYFNRLVARASKIQSAIISKGVSVTAAKETVDLEIKDQRWSEVETHYLAERVDNLLRSIRQIIDVIGRRTTHLRDEVKSTQYNTGQRQ